MGVKLQSALGGSVELNAPSTASNFTMTVPAGNGTVATTDQLQNFRNKVYNGSLLIWQRGTFTTDLSTFSADRWAPLHSGSGGVVIRSRISTDLPPDNRVKYKLTTTQFGANRTSVAAYGHRQSFEIGDILDMFNGGPYTVSFWYRSNITGSAAVRISNDQGGGQVGGSQITQAFTYSTANVWQFVTVTINLNALTTRPSAAENTIGGFLDIGAHVGGVGPTTITTGQYFEVALIQLEKGSVATTFEHRPYQVELALCQRYFAVIMPRSVDVQQILTRTSATDAVFNITTPVSMRAVPTLSAPTNGRFIAYDTSFNLIVATATLITLQNTLSLNSFHLGVTNTSVSGAYVYASLDLLSSVTDMTLSAEL